MVSTDKSAAMTGFFDEVKRRKVYQVAAAISLLLADNPIGLCRVSGVELPNWRCVW